MCLLLSCQVNVKKCERTLSSRLLSLCVLYTIYIHECTRSFFSRARESQGCGWCFHYQNVKRHDGSWLLASNTAAAKLPTTALRYIVRLAQLFSFHVHVYPKSIERNRFVLLLSCVFSRLALICLLCELRSSLALSCVWLLLFSFLLCKLAFASLNIFSSTLFIHKHSEKDETWDSRDTHFSLVKMSHAQSCECEFKRERETQSKMLIRRKTK